MGGAPPPFFPHVPSTYPQCAAAVLTSSPVPPASARSPLPPPRRAVLRDRRTRDGSSGCCPFRFSPAMAIPAMVSNATKTGYYLVLLVMSLTVMCVVGP